MKLTIAKIFKKNVQKYENFMIKSTTQFSKKESICYLGTFCYISISTEISTTTTISKVGVTPRVKTTYY